LIDIDGTINTFPTQFIVEVMDLGYDFDVKSYYKTGDWDIAKYIVGTDNQKKVMNQICTTMEFWEKIPPIPEAQTVLKKINAEHEVLIVTTPWAEDEKFKVVKRKWMNKHFRFIKDSQIIFSNEKWLLDADIIIDDKPDTIEKCNKKMITIVPEHSYNKNIECDYRFTNWNEVPKYLKRFN
jgi:5'(3')-deoxyribonucleotidase